MARSELDALIEQHELASSVVLAMICAEREFIVVGAAQSIALLCGKLRDEKVVIIEEPSAYVLHSLCCAEMVKRVNGYLAKVDCRPPCYPLLNHAGEYIAIGQAIVKSLLTSFMYEPIDVPKVVQCLTSCTQLIQIGPSFLTPAIFKKYLPQTSVKVILQRKDL